jgi:hypothetical protein
LVSSERILSAEKDISKPDMLTSLVISGCKNWNRENAY